MLQNKVRQTREVNETFLLYNGVGDQDEQSQIGHEDNGQDLSVILKYAIGSGPTEGGGNNTREGTG